MHTLCWLTLPIAWHQAAQVLSVNLEVSLFITTHNGFGLRARVLENPTSCLNHTSMDTLTNKHAMGGASASSADYGSPGWHTLQ